MSAATAEHTGTLFFRGLGHTQRARMLDAMTWAVAEKGYPNVTVADVVGRAGVSRRTFYEHFDDRLDCFLAAYETGADAVIAEISDQLRPLRDGNGMTRLRTSGTVAARALAACGALRCRSRAASSRQISFTWMKPGSSPTKGF